MLFGILSCQESKLSCRLQDDLNLVVCYGFGNVPMMLITKLKSDDKRLSVAVVKVYLMRWKIEEYYRFKKQQFNLEDMRVWNPAFGLKKRGTQIKKIIDI